MTSTPKQSVKIVDKENGTKKMKLSNMLDETEHGRVKIDGMKIVIDGSIKYVKVSTKGRVRNKSSKIFICTKYGSWEGGEVTWSRLMNFSNSKKAHTKNLPPCLSQAEPGDEVWVETRTRGSEKLVLEYLTVSITWTVKQKSVEQLTDGKENKNKSTDYLDGVEFDIMEDPHGGNITSGVRNIIPSLPSVDFSEIVETIASGVGSGLMAIGEGISNIDF